MKFDAENGDRRTDECDKSDGKTIKFECETFIRQFDDRKPIFIRTTRTTDNDCSYDHFMLFYFLFGFSPFFGYFCFVLFGCSFCSLFWHPAAGFYAI